MFRPLSPMPPVTDLLKDFRLRGVPLIEVDAAVTIEAGSMGYLHFVPAVVGFVDEVCVFRADSGVPVKLGDCDKEHHVMVIGGLPVSDAACTLIRVPNGTLIRVEGDLMIRPGQTVSVLVANAYDAPITINGKLRLDGVDTQGFQAAMEGLLLRGLPSDGPPEPLFDVHRVGKIVGEIGLNPDRPRLPAGYGPGGFDPDLAPPPSGGRVFRVLVVEAHADVPLDQLLVLHGIELGRDPGEEGG